MQFFSRGANKQNRLESVQYASTARKRSPLREGRDFKMREAIKIERARFGRGGKLAATSEIDCRPRLCDFASQRGISWRAARVPSLKGRKQAEHKTYTDSCCCVTNNYRSMSA